MEKDYLERIKYFLNEETVEAKITKVALSVVAVAGVMGVAFLAVGMGNAIQIFSKFKKSKKYSKTQIKSSVINLHKQKLIEYVSNKNGVTTVRITKKGESILKSFSIDLIKIQKPRQWDQKWRLVMFDLPIKYTKVRNSLRFKLKQLGFIQFQKSAWIYPYPCIDEILFITDYYKVKKYVELLEVSSITNETNFIKAFNLENRE